MKYPSVEDQIKDLLNSVSFNTAKDDDDLDTKYYQDPFLTAEQDKRDEQITRLLTAYVDSYEKKVKGSKCYRRIIFGACIVVIIAITFFLGYSAIQVANWEDELQISNLVAFVTACISFVSLIIGLSTIITKYFFPENDEQYITKIVGIIQNNDFKNKQEIRSHPAENSDSAQIADLSTSNPSDSLN